MIIGDEYYKISGKIRRYKIRRNLFSINKVKRCTFKKLRKLVPLCMVRENQWILNRVNRKHPTHDWGFNRGYIWCDRCGSDGQDIDLKLRCDEVLMERAMR